MYQGIVTKKFDSFSCGLFVLEVRRFQFDYISVPWNQ